MPKIRSLIITTLDSQNLLTTGLIANMADRRPDTQAHGRIKRQKTAEMDTRSSPNEADTDPRANPYLAHFHEEPAEKEDPKSNPYLAHMYEESADDTSYNGYSNGYGKTTNRVNGVSNFSSLARFPRHKSTATMAKKAEDGPNNPFSGQPLSSQYFNILKTRRNLPVHAQR